MSRNCSDVNSCPQNQECIYTGSGYGYCICPKGFTLEANGFCRDINECQEMSEFDVCGANAQCVNLPGSYECLCAPGYSGVARDGCTRICESFELPVWLWSSPALSLLTPHLIAFHRPILRERRSVPHQSEMQPQVV